MLGPAVKAGKAVVGEAWCYRHNRVCQYPTCTVHVAGSSCTDSSVMGDQLGTDGHTSIRKLAWFGMRRLKREPIVIIENVPGYPEHVIKEFLGDIYNIDVVRACASNYWLQRRARKFWVLIRKDIEQQSNGMPCLDSFMCEHHRRIRTVSWRDLMTADTPELDSELAWGRSRSSAACPALPRDDPAAFESLLNTSEAAYLHSYKTLHPPSYDSLAAYSLSQDPSSGYKMLTTSRWMHTLIKNVGLIFVPHAPPFDSGRWITPFEALLMQGTSLQSANAVVLVYVIVVCVCVLCLFAYLLFRCVSTFRIRECFSVMRFC